MIILSSSLPSPLSPQVLREAPHPRERLRGVGLCCRRTNDRRFSSLLKVIHSFIYCNHHLLTTTTISFVVRNFAACSRQPSFAQLSRDRLRLVLESGQVCMETEELVNIILSWAHSNGLPNVSLAALSDLLPPAVLFNDFNRRYLLGQPVALW